MKVTPKEVEEAVESLKLSMLENLQASHAEDNAKQRRIKAHYNYVRAKEEFRALELN